KAPVDGIYFAAAQRQPLYEFPCPSAVTHTDAARIRASQAGPVRGRIPDIGLIEMENLLLMFTAGNQRPHIAVAQWQTLDPAFGRVSINNVVLHQVVGHSGSRRTAGSRPARAAGLGRLLAAT